MTTAADKTLVATLNRALNGANASAADFAAQLEKVGNIETLAKTEGDKFAALSNAEFAAKLLANLGISAATIGAESFAALEPAIIDYMGTLGAPNRGLAALQAAQLLATKADDATFGTAAKAFNAAVAVDAVAYDPLTFLLTTGKDTFTGKGMDDVFTGVVNALSTANTLNATDVLDGGEGSDTLKLDVAAAFAGLTTGSVKNIEIVELTNSGSVARTFTATGITGVDQYTLAGALNLAGLAEIDTVVAGARTADLTITYAAKVTDGTADSLNLSVTDFGKIDDPSTTTTDEEDAVVVTVAGIETTNITTAGTSVLDLSGVASKALTLAGDGTLVVADLNAATNTIDGSGLAADTELRLASVSSATSVSTGSGDDTILLNISDDVTANAVVAGGDGADNLIVTGANATTVQLNQSGVETLSFGDQAGALTMSLKNTTGITNVVALGQAADAGDLDENVTLASFGAGDVAISIQGVNASGAVLSVDTTGASTVSVNTPASTATTTAPSANDVDVTLANTTSVDMTVASKMSYGGVVTAAKANTVSVNLQGAATTGSKIDAATAASITISAVAAASDLDLVAGKATSLTIANAKDLDLQGSTLSALETLTSSGAGDLNLTGVALAKLNVASITNKGDVDLNNLGSGTLDYGISVSATGAATFDVGTITTNSQAVDLTVDAVGAVTAGDIDAGKGAVNVEISTTSTVALAAITGKNVTVDVTGALGAVTYGDDITVSGNFTFKGAELTATDLQTKNVVLTGTAQTVSLTGGIGNDIFDIVGGADQTSITVSGNLDIGVNDLTIDSSASAAAQTISIASLTNYDTATITGGSGKNSITGGADADTINGGAAADTINGGAGADTINGADGTDTLTGGSGADKFQFTYGDNAGADGAAVADIITDFVVGTDKLQFTAIVDVVSGQQAAVQTAVSALASTATDAQIATAMANANTTDLGVSFAVFGGNTYVYLEKTGATTTHVEADNIFIKLTGVTTAPTFAADVVA